MNSRISIIIVNFNGWSDTVECVNSILGNDFSNFHLILLDNNSPNDSAVRITRFLIDNPIINNLRIIDYDGSFVGYFSTPFVSEDEREVTFIRSNKNKGFAGGNNICLKWLVEFGYVKEFTPSNKIFLLNPDTVIPDDCLQKISDIDDKLFLASLPVYNYRLKSQLLHNGGFHINRYFGIIRNINSNDEIDYVYGGALITNFETFRILGYLPEEYFLYWEETDYCTQAKLKNIPLNIIYTTHIWDKVGQSIGRGKLANYYFVRNSFYFYNKFYPEFIVSLFIFNLCRVCYKLIKLDFSSVQGMFLGIKDYLLNIKNEKSFR